MSEPGPIIIDSGSPVVVPEPGPVVAAAGPVVGTPQNELPNEVSANSDETDDGQGPLLMNPPENSKAVRYLANGRAFTMQAGALQELGLGNWEVRFDRGGDYGEARYTLENRAYEFQLGKKGWDLRPISSEVTIDNTRCGKDFNYVADDQKYTVKAGQRRTHTSNRPVVVQFDHGDGSQASKLLRSGAYRVGADATKRRLDLFPADNEPMAAK